MTSLSFALPVLTTLSASPSAYLWGNSPQAVVLALAWFIGINIVIWFILHVVLRALRGVALRTRIGVYEVVATFLEGVPALIWTLLAFLLVVRDLILPIIILQTINVLLFVTFVILAVLLAQRVIEYMIAAHLPRLRRDATETPAVLRATILIILWTLGVLLVLSNIGINVLSLVTGLGIGGVAVALAVQNILGDIFSSFSIYLDQPFKEGDFIIVGQDMGTVKRVGMKSTRILSLSGEEIVISNRELTSVRVQNYKRMKERRVVFTIGVTYDTPVDKMKAIPETIKKIIESQSPTRFDRAHFSAFADSSLNFEIVYYVLDPDYTKYMDIQQTINLELMKAFAKDKIEFAFPTRTVYVAK
ncbi:MAG TPA: mechanosensitive ion channel family protein [Candidatus Peribacteraceae bacterium]|nr:mechanosensitive ion channel family protein [Candidatus Peribacteraceae bacterium]